MARSIVSIDGRPFLDDYLRSTGYLSHCTAKQFFVNRGKPVSELYIDSTELLCGKRIIVNYTIKGEKTILSGGSYQWERINHTQLIVAVMSRSLENNIFLIPSFRKRLYDIISHQFRAIGFSYQINLKNVPQMQLSYSSFVVFLELL